MLERRFSRLSSLVRAAVLASLALLGCGGSDEALVLLNLRAEADVPKMAAVKVQVGNQQGIWAQQDFMGDPPRAGDPLKVGVYVREGLSGPIVVVAIGTDAAGCEVGRGATTGTLPARGKATLEVLLKRSGACGGGAGGGTDGGGALPGGGSLAGDAAGGRDVAGDVAMGGGIGADGSQEAGAPGAGDGGGDARGDAAGDGFGDGATDGLGDATGMGPLPDRPAMPPVDGTGGALDGSGMSDAALDAAATAPDAPGLSVDQAVVPSVDAAPDQAVDAPAVADAEPDASAADAAEPDLAPTPDAEEDAAPDVADDAPPDMTLSPPDVAPDVPPDMAVDAPPPPDTNPGLCNQVVQSGCGGGERCSVSCNLNPPPLTVKACIANAASPVPIGGICSTTAECVAGSHCLLVMGNTRRCHKYCSGDPDCPLGSTTGVCRWELTCGGQRTGVFCCDLP